MSSYQSVRVSWNTKNIKKIEKNGSKGLARLGFAIASNARARAPYLTGALSNSIRVQVVDGNSVDVVAGGSFGGKAIRYAWQREQGPNRNPATEHYMERAMNDVMGANPVAKFFGGLA